LEPVLLTLADGVALLLGVAVSLGVAVDDALHWQHSGRIRCMVKPSRCTACRERNNALHRLVWHGHLGATSVLTSRSLLASPTRKAWARGCCQQSLKWWLSEKVMSCVKPWR